MLEQGFDDDDLEFTKLELNFRVTIFILFPFSKSVGENNTLNGARIYQGNPNSTIYIVMQGSKILLAFYDRILYSV